jgi:hypothetical protein
MKSRWFLFILPIICVSILVSRLSDGKTTPFEWDRLGYYSYLPAIFIYHDISTLSFYPEMIRKYELAGHESWYATFPQPNGKRLNKYAIGSSLFQLPFFLLAHGYADVTERYPPDGFSLPYQYAAAFSGVWWVVLGIAFLRRFLLRYFSDTVVLITIMCIALGTNLFDYTVVSIGMSHPYSFFLFAALLYFTDVLYATGKSRYLYLLAFILGLIVIIRPINILVALLPLLWRVNSSATLQARLYFLRGRSIHLLLSCVLFALVAFIQLAYWKHVTGHWVYFSYEGEGFNFLRPEIWKGLFSWRKGWFIYTPIAFLGCLGFYSLWKKDRTFIPALLLFFALFIYVVFSWWNWFYGGSFGCRPLIESLALLSLPLSAFIERIKRYGGIIQTAALSIISFLIALNLFQTYQHSKNIIHFDRMTFAYYWKIFGKTEFDPESRQYLMSEEEYVKDFEELKNR